MSEEWGPWIEHDGKGCPCVGQYVHVFFSNGKEVFGLAGRSRAKAVSLGLSPDGSWDWGNSIRASRVVRYRIRKPRGLTMLEHVARDVPAPIEQVTA